MKPRPPLPPGPYLIVGLARSGVAAALALRRADPSTPIAGCDRGSPPEALEAAERLERAGVEIRLGTDGTELLAASRRPRTVVKSPGVPSSATVVAQAREQGVGVVGELEIGWLLLPNDFCAVTGTNGKTTTTELIGAIHREAGRRVAVAGNVGNPVSGAVGELEPDVTVVCEASSFQLEDSEAFAPEVAVFLNFSADHLDRHADVDAYLDAKLHLFDRQEDDDVAVLNAGEPVLAERSPGGAARRVWFGERSDCELRLEAGKLRWQGRPFMDAAEVGLRGRHNLENAMAAGATALSSGIETDAVRSALRSFRGLPHRLEEVARVGGVLYVNDSKATNVSAAVAALRAFPGSVHAVLGGSSKGGGFRELAPVVAERCAACYLIGEAAERLEEDLRQTGVELIRSGDLDRAVLEASSRARPGETVMLAPACASFDQYRDFEERGEHFRALVAEVQSRSGGGEAASA